MYIKLNVSFTLTCNHAIACMNRLWLRITASATCIWIAWNKVWFGGAVVFIRACIIFDALQPAHGSINCLPQSCQGREMRLFQGLNVRNLSPPCVSGENLLADLAGNSFSAPVVSAGLMSLLLTIPCDSESETEELRAINNVFQMARFG